MRHEIRDFFRTKGVIGFDLSINPRFHYPENFDTARGDEMKTAGPHRWLALR
jgi:hypothetical protein